MENIVYNAYTFLNVKININLKTKFNAAKVT